MKKIVYLFSKKEWYSHSLFRIITVKDTQDGEWTKKRRCAPEKGLVKQRTVMP